MSKETKEVKEKVQISIAQVKADLAAGIDRNQMKEKYGLNRANIIRLFKHPELKGLKVKRESDPENDFVIVDDTTSASTNGDGTSQEVAQTDATSGVKKEGW